MGKNYSSEKTLPADGIVPKHVSEEKPALAGIFQCWRLACI